LLFYAAAALPRPTWDRLVRVARRVRSRPVPFVSAWGATETSPLVTQPQVTPGYFKDSERFREMLDEEGFYAPGDAVLLADPEDPNQGLVFNGRVSEDFKLTTGTWVHVGALRLKLIAALAPLVQDVVIAGHDRDAVGVLLFPDIAACARETGDRDALRARIAA